MDLHRGGEAKPINNSDPINFAFLHSKDSKEIQHHLHTKQDNSILGTILLGHHLPPPPSPLPGLDSWICSVFILASSYPAAPDLSIIIIILTIITIHGSSLSQIININGYFILIYCKTTSRLFTICTIIQHIKQTGINFSFY